MASVDGTDPLQFLDFQERQALKDMEDEIVEILLILDSTSDTISSVTDMYKQFCHDSRTTSQDANDEFDLISFSLNEKQRDVAHNRKKVETLQVRAQGTSKLVRIFFFLILIFQISDEKTFSYPAFWTFKMEIRSESLQKSPKRRTLLYESLPRKAREMLLQSRYLQS